MICFEGAISEEMQAASRGWQKQGNNSSLGPLEGTSSADTLIKPGETHFGLLIFRTEGTKSVLF